MDWIYSVDPLPKKKTKEKENEETEAISLCSFETCFQLSLSFLEDESVGVPQFIPR